MVAEAVLKVKQGKACGLSGIIIEMVKAGGDAYARCYYRFDQPDN